MKKNIRNLIVILLSILSVNTYANNNQDSLKTRCDTLFNKGKKSILNKDLKKGLQLFSEAIEVLSHIDIEKLNQKEKNGLSRCLSYRAYYCIENNFYLNRSIDDTKERIKVIKDSLSSPLGKAHNLLARIYEKQGEYELAETHFKNAIDIFQKLNDSYNKYSLNNNLATLYFKQKKYDLALKTLALYYSNLTDPLDKSDYSLTYGNIYDKKGEFELAYDYYKQGLSYASDTTDIAKFKNNLGITLRKLKRSDEAIFELDDYYQLLRKIHKSNYNTKYAIYFNNKGDVFRDQGNLDSALVYHNSAVMYCLNDSLNKQDVYKNPSNKQLKLCEIKPYLLECLKSKANTAYLLFKKSNQKKYLELSQECYLTYDQLFKIMWQEYASSESKLFWLSDSRENYLNAIDGAIKNKKIGMALSFANSSKAVLLNEQLEKLDWASASNIPQELFDREKELNLKRAIINSNSEKLALYNELEDLWDEMKENDPLYFSSMYEVPQFDITKIQNELDSETSILQFIYSKNTIHTFLITKDTLLAKSINIDSTFEGKLHQFKKVLINDFAENGLKNNYGAVLTDIGYELYKKLLEPFEIHFKESIIFIPDGELNGIPFAALPTKAHQIKNLDYQSVPYLVKNYSSSYGNSLDVLLKQMLMKIETNKKYLGVAPIYFKEFDLPDLDHTQIEVEKAKELFEDSRLLLGKEASISSFIENSNSYNIVHLATHGTEFDPATKTPAIYLADGPLGLEQIYSTPNKNTNLIIISTCKGGLGVSIKGEGVMSLSRGFAFNGVPSMLSTINNVEEKSSAYLSNLFLKFIKAKERKNVALQKTQLKMINNDSEETYAMPYQWANYILIGDTKALYDKKTNYLAYFGAMLCFLVVLGLFFKMK